MKKLCRSKLNKMIGGVCGGLGEYFNVDPTIIRLLFAFLTLTMFAAPVIILIYIIMWIIIPLNPEQE